MKSYSPSSISRNELAQDKTPSQSSMKHDVFFLEMYINVHTHKIVGLGCFRFIFANTSTSGHTRYGQPALEALEKSCSWAKQVDSGSILTGPISSRPFPPSSQPNFFFS